MDDLNDTMMGVSEVKDIREAKKDDKIIIEETSFEKQILEPSEKLASKKIVVNELVQNNKILCD